MSTDYTGGCACGAVRYSIAAEPLSMLDCQCRQCQRESGTGHASHLTFASAGVSVSGAVTRWEMTGDGGTLKSRAFCPVCGSPVYMTFPAMPDYFVVRAASLDQPQRYRPQFVTWHSAGHAWDAVDADLPRFETMPPG